MTDIVSVGDSMNWKKAVKKSIPPALLNKILVSFPFLYRTNLVRYEANLSTRVIDELLAQLGEGMKVTGDIAECGSSRCGGSILMANFLRSNGVKKVVYAFDSFEGFDTTELKAEQKLGLTTTTDSAFTSTSLEYVTQKINSLGFAGAVVPVKGYFQKTLPHVTTPLCFAFIDCDLRESVAYCAETLWPLLTSGGRMAFHDYTSVEYKGAKIAVDEFVQSHTEEIGIRGVEDDLYFISKK